MNKSFTITLTKKMEEEQYARPSTSYSFGNVNTDLVSIYQHFSLLSYFTPACKIRILNRSPFKSGSSVIVDEFQIKDEEKVLYLFEVEKDSYKNIFLQNEVSHSLNIKYTVGETRDEVSDQNNIFVKFITEIKNRVEYIHIQIEDENDWIRKNFDDIEVDRPKSRISEMRKTKAGELEYFYIEPASQRTKKFKAKHYSLALQGGGVKGLAYIGAYNGIKSYNSETIKEDIPIKSIIGSSAGGILGLGICCQMSEKQIRQLIEVDLATITTDKAFPVEDRQFVREKLLCLKSFFEEYGILATDITGLIERAFEKEQFQKTILEIFQMFNPSIKQLFDIDHKLSLTGLLNAALMSGNKMKEIGKKCLKTLQTNPKYQEKIRPFIEMKGEEWTERLTMRELYQVTGVEFTCTSVDIDSKILRFFNHKTTPDLPACRAVQMTGSFPVAFQAQHWDRSWGKYYIHFDRLRRQVDITGHQFTDGGMLANFPIKYLDNEFMRPMYFSHPKINEGQNQTIMYGFGLNAVKPPQTIDYSEKISKLISIVKAQATGWNIFGTAWNFLSGLVKDPRPTQKNIDSDTNPLRHLKQIPLFQFGGRLLNTFINTKDNLTEECFSHDVYETQIDNSLKKLSLSYNYVNDNITKVQKFAQFFYEKKVKQILEIDNESYEYIFSVLLENLEFFKQVLENSPYTQFNLVRVEKIFNYIISKFLFFRITYQKQINPQYKENGGVDKVKKYFSSSIIKMDKMNLSKIFSLSQIKRDFERTIGFVEEAIKWFKDVNGGDYGQKELKATKVALKRMRDEEEKKITYYHSLLANYIQELKNIPFQRQYIPLNQNDMRELMKMSKVCATTKVKPMLELIEQIKVCEIDQFQIFFQAFDNRDTITAYTEHMLQEGRRNNIKDIHLVLQSVPLSELYFHEYMTFVNSTIQQFNAKFQDQEKFKITSITSSNFHSVVMFLYASDFSPEQIHKEVWNIRHKIQPNPRTKQQYDSLSWTKNNVLAQRQLQEETWKNRKEIYELAGVQLKEFYQKKDDGKKMDRLKQKIIQRRSQCADSGDMLNESISVSIDYVVDSVLNVDPKLSPDQQIQQISKKLSINLSQGKAFNDQNKKNQEQMIKLVNFLSSKYLDLIKYFIYASPMVAEDIAINVNLEERKEIWKGLIICEAMNIFQLKSYVCETLIKLGLKPHTTLKEFYDLSDKKITLNFTAIESSAKAIRIYNHHTRPYMPLWAAIIATSSIPEFFQPVLDMRQWSFKPIRSLSERQTKAYFHPEIEQPGTLISADILTKLPLDLLSNHKIQAVIHAKKEIFLTFNFGDYKIKELGIVKQIKCKPLSLYQAGTNKNILSNISSVFGIPLLAQKSSRFEVYINSHDNLISQIYKRELAKLPIRVQTLDFSLMSQGGKLTPISEDAIMQSEYVVLEKLINNDLNEGDRYIFMRIQSPRAGQKEDLLIRFLSKLNPTNSMMENYRTFYTLKEQINEQHNFVEVNDQFLPIVFPSQDKSALSLKICFPVYKNPKDKATLYKKTICHQLDLSVLRRILAEKKPGQGFVYRVNFNNFHSQTVTVIPEKSQDKASRDTVLRYRSFMGPEMDKDYHFYCDICYGVDFKLVQYFTTENGQSKYKCSGRNCSSNEKGESFRLIYQCQSCPQNSNVMYCAACKYKPYMKEGKLICALGHKMKNKTARLEHYFKTKNDCGEGALNFSICDICQSTSINQFLTDSECGIDICEACRITFIQEE